MRRDSLLGVTLLLTILSASPALAWGDDGHKIACDIAYRALTLTAKATVDDLIATDGRFPNFAESCPWPDHLDPNSTYEARPSWHYLNMRRGDPTVDAGDCDPVKHCVLYAIDTYLRKLQDKRLDKMKRAWALEFLAHFVADVHQPLHVSFADDQGGNKIPVIWFDGEPTNLHFVWDFVAIQTEEREQWASVPPDRRWERYAAKLESEITAAEREKWRGVTPVAWAQESYDLARTPKLDYVDAKPDEALTLGRDYFYMARAIIETRLKAAGLRLAAMLNQAFDR